MPPSGPFSPAQQTLILCAIAGFVLIACVNLVFRRSPIFRYTPLGMLVLALAAGATGLIAFYAIDFVKQHPLRFLSVPAFGLIVFFICAKIDQYREAASGFGNEHADNAMATKSRHHRAAGDRVRRPPGVLPAHRPF